MGGDATVDAAVVCRRWVALAWLVALVWVRVRRAVGAVAPFARSGCVGGVAAPMVAFQRRWLAVAMSALSEKIKKS